MQKNLLEQGNTKDYYVFESVLKGNYLLKNNWKQEMRQGLNNSNSVANIQGLTVRAGGAFNEASGKASYNNDLNTMNNS